MKNKPFFKAIRSKKNMELSKKIKAMGLLFHVAMCASRDGEGGKNWVKIDYKSLGLTQAEFRTIKTFLENNELATSRTTNRGTWIKLISKSVFDINETGNNEQNNEPTTSLNKEYKNINKNIKQEEIKGVIVPDQTGSTLSTIPPQQSPPPPLPQESVDVVIDLFAMARDNPEVARRLVAMGVV